MKNIKLAEDKWKIVLETELLAEMSKAPSVVSSHDIGHIMRVLKHAKKIARNIDVDWEVLIAAIYLHDIGRHYPEGIREHGPISVPYAEDVLNRIKFPSEKIPNVVLSIKFHDETFTSDKRSTIESKVLYDADKLDVFGSAGVSRYLIFNAMRGKTLKETVDYALKNLPVRFQGLELEETRSVGKESYKYALDFFKKLDTEIS